MTNLEIIKAIRDEFMEGLKEKTNWGRNDLKNVFERSVANATAKVLDKKGR